MMYARALAGIAGLVLLAGCSADLGGVGDVVGLTGAAKPQALAVGDEPFAVKVAAATLAQGGSAADAAAAMYFALSVTYPVAAGLGAGGICLVHDPLKAETEEFDFLPQEAAGGGSYAIPGAVRGFALLQASYGVLPWQKVVAPGEGYAAAGFPISRALAVRLADAGDVIRLDAGLSAQFLDEEGHVKAAGVTVNNLDLAQTLGAIRSQGPGGFYSGPVAAKIAAYAAAEGGAITPAELGDYKAQAASPRVAQMGSQTVYLPSQKTSAGAFAGVMLDNLSRAQTTDVGTKDLQASIVYAVQQSLKAIKVTDLPKDLGSTGFATMDTRGQAVACAITMNGPFGSGRTARGTGVTLAKASGASGLASAFLTPLIAAPRGDSSAALAGAGAGGPNGAAAIFYALARIASGDEIATRKDLRTTGVAPYDTVNAIICTGSTCAALPDPATNGLGAAVPTREK